MPDATEADLQAGRNAADAVNGSGPVDSAGAQKAAKSFMGFLLDQQVGSDGQTVTQGVPWLLLGLGVVVVGFILLRRRG